MQKILSSRIVRVTGCHEAEVVWYLREPTVHHGTMGLVDILWDAQGLDGVYSCKWLWERRLPVSIRRVLKEIGAPPPLRLRNTARDCDGKTIKWDPVTAPDPMKDWVFGKSDILAVLWPWTPKEGVRREWWERQWGCAGFDSMVLAGLYVEDSWAAARWSLTDRDEHTARLLACTQGATAPPSSGRVTGMGNIWYLQAVPKHDSEEEEEEERSDEQLAGVSGTKQARPQTKKKRAGVKQGRSGRGDGGRGGEEGRGRELVEPQKGAKGSGERKKRQTVRSR